ncbi:NUDIX domain-containing protein [Arenibacterium sp. CAU 1754]
MADLFFYGTLCHLPLLEIVLGRRIGDGAAVPAELPGHAIFWVQNQSFPTIEPYAGATAQGLLVRDLDPGDIDRLRFYEGGFDYDLQHVSVDVQDGACPARVFFPRPGLWTAGAPWSLADWVERWGAIQLRAAQEIMGWYGRMDPDALAKRMTGIRLRAAAWVAAQNRPGDPERDIDRDVVVQAHHRPYVNFFAVEEMDLQFRLHDGGLSRPLNRGAQVLGQAVVVLPYDPRRDAVLLVEQFRAPVFIGGDRAPWVWEPVAGLIDPGETPECTARREALEEAGLTLGHLDPVAGTYSSTGSSSEFVHMYVGLTDLDAPRPDIGGLDSEGEDIRSRILSFDELMAGVDAHQFRDMPLVVTALWLARHRSRLRELG